MWRGLDLKPNNHAASLFMCDMISAVFRGTATKLRSRNAMRIPQITCLLVLGIWVVVATPTAKAGPITLVAAPSAGGSYYGMYCVSCVGTSFTLSNVAYVNTIGVTLYSPLGTSFTT